MKRKEKVNGGGGRKYGCCYITVDFATAASKKGFAYFKECII
jgi:hypothetical protein